MEHLCGFFDGLLNIQAHAVQQAQHVIQGGGIALCMGDFIQPSGHFLTAAFKLLLMQAEDDTQNHLSIGPELKCLLVEQHGRSGVARGTVAVVIHVAQHHGNLGDFICKIAQHGDIVSHLLFVHHFEMQQESGHAQQFLIIRVLTKAHVEAVGNFCKVVIFNGSLHISLGYGAAGSGGNGHAPAGGIGFNTAQGSRKLFIDLYSGHTSGIKQLSGFLGILLNT